MIIHKLFLFVFLSLVCEVSLAQNQVLDPTSVTHTKVTVVDIDLPGVELKDKWGKTVLFSEFVDSKVTTILTFDFTSCTTVCPAIHAIFSKLSKELHHQGKMVKMLSISIDPDYDTPDVIKQFDEKMETTPLWNHYTSSVPVSIALQKAFNVYHGDKMNHQPVIFIKTFPGSKWIRLDGFPTPKEIISEIDKSSVSPQFGDY